MEKESEAQSKLNIRENEEGKGDEGSDEQIGRKMTKMKKPKGNYRERSVINVDMEKKRKGRKERWRALYKGEMTDMGGRLRSRGRSATEGKKNVQRLIKVTRGTGEQRVKDK